jgi:hypothetical protein
MNKPRKPLWKRILRSCTFAIIAFATLAALALSWISFQSRREWAKTKADLIARGEKLSMVELAPPPIPDEQNFFADPLWREVSEVESFTDAEGKSVTQPKVPYKEQKLTQALAQKLPPSLKDRANDLPGVGVRDGEVAMNVAQRASAAIRRVSDKTDRKLLAQLVVDSLQPMAPTIAQVIDLLKRSGARAQIDYSLGPVAPIPHLNILMRLNQILSARAIANLYLGRPESSAEDVLSLLRLADTIKSEPVLISFLVRTSLIGMATWTISEGIRDHLWTDGQLAGFAPKLDTIDLWPQFELVLRGERGSLNQFVELWQQSPARARDIIGNNQGNGTGILEQKYLKLACYEIGARLFNSSDQSAYNRMVQKQVDAIARASVQGVAPEDFPSQKSDDEGSARFHPLWAVFSPLLPSPASSICYTQDRMTLTRIACALERHWLQDRSYPESLRALVPSLLPDVPSSVLAGQKIHYRPEGSGAFRLWTAGWDKVDEEGSAASARAGSRNRNRGDWVWWVPPLPLPAKRQPSPP